MVDNLAESLEKLDLRASSLNLGDEYIDSILDRERPSKRIKQDPEELKRELERKHLTPSTAFSTSWLNKLQQYDCLYPSYLLS
jgi:antiviral helicase SKI2